MNKIVHPFEKPVFKIARENDSKTFGEFVIEPLEYGFALTIGNALRRVLLSSLPGASVYGVTLAYHNPEDAKDDFRPVLHEFTAMPGIEEDVTMIILNLKDLILKIDGNDDTTKKLELEAHGPCTVYAKDIQAPSDVDIINGDLEIAHIAEGGVLKMTIYAQNGRGYVTCDENKILHRDSVVSSVGFIATDSNYSPVTKANYKDEKTRVGHDSRYDKLKLEVTTNGSMSPADAVSLASRILISHFEKFIDLSETVANFETFKDEEVQAADKLQNIKIEELDLTVRSYNCLKRQGYQTVQELTNISEDEIMKFRNLGKKSLKEIEDKLAELGLSFKKSN